MRKVVVVVLGCLLLAGCAANWQGEEVRYKIVSQESQSSSEFFKLELVGDAPKGALKPEDLKSRSLLTFRAEGAQVGDELLCVVEQKKGNAFGNSNVVTNLQSCKKA
ncbi:hypothetical protein SK571_06990 [Lentzea sp. BCCO 10_0798]|jgi:hypothetical protein|uniref:Lipoprotein n=1 Tax=Lentzea kristufekii TaxID=3095430 RepID=A0ABU4TLF9_9PSEU|nr:hypothetical protein [Lentzea sp. BCCO 10_0798]MDX8049120.1 hypothetical protein [Lentzea sp. BCCO 10_0798]